MQTYRTQKQGAETQLQKQERVTLQETGPLLPPRHGVCPVTQDFINYPPFCPVISVWDYHLLTTPPLAGTVTTVRCLAVRLIRSQDARVLHKEGVIIPLSPETNWGFIRLNNSPKVTQLLSKFTSKFSYL